MTLRPAVVDVRDGSSAVRVEVRTADTAPPGLTASGVAAVQVLLVSPLGDHVDLEAKALRLASGTRLDGTWRGAVRLPRWVTGGRWRLARMTIVDMAGNARDFVDAPALGSAPSGPDDLSLRSWSTSTRVQSDADNRLPVLRHLHLSRRHVDTTDQPAVVTVTARARDAKSGVRSIVVGLGNPRIAVAQATARLHRRPHTHMWRGRLVVPTWVRSSTWHATVFVLDRAGNEREYVAADLAALGASSRLRVTSRSDRGRPRLDRLQVSPTAVDVRTGPATVHVRARAADIRSGVTAVNALLIGPAGDRLPVTLARTDGSATRGRWAGAVTVPRCAPPGRWRVVVHVTDRGGNVRRYGASDLTDRGWPGQVEVTSTPVDRTAPQLTVDSVSTSAVTLRFDEAVSGVSTTSLRVYPASDFAHPLTITALTCSSGTGATVDCADGPVRQVVAAVALSSGTRYAVFANAGAVRVQVTDVAGNPVGWAAGAGFRAPS